MHMGGDPTPGPLSHGRRLRLASQIAIDSMRVYAGLKTRRLPDLVRSLAHPGRAGQPLDPRRLGRIVHRVMNVGPFRPRCLTMSLVLFRILHRQGTPADLVLGLPPKATNHIAHAWVEVDGKVVGPPDGRMGHAELARYGASTTGNATSDPD